MAQLTVEDYVLVYEASDGGTGDPRLTVWQFFIGAQPVTTKNPELAETIRLAVDSNSKVKATYDDQNANTLLQARIVFTYVCESVQITGCGPVDEAKSICVTKRYSPCKGAPLAPPA